MRYLLLMYRDQALFEALAPGDHALWVRACAANDDALRASGQLVAAETLQGGKTALTLRLEQGKLTLDDQQVAQDGQHLIGLCVVDARDLNAAVQVASRMPQVRAGPIEVHALIEHR